MKPGDLLGVCAPSGPVDPGRLQEGVAALASLGFRVRVPDGLLSRRRLAAGSVERRVAELHGLFADTEVAGILCARGGEGASWLLPELDPGLLQAHPKVFVGYSDATFLHLLLGRLGLVSFHGPMVAVDFPGSGYDRASFLSAVTGAGEAYSSSPDDLVPLLPGQGEGRLQGGCLSILAAAAGTPWALEPEPSGSLLFLEDVDERPYEIDRMLFQLRSSGGLASVKGIVFGDMKGCHPRFEADYTLEEILSDALGDLGVPVALGLSSGHTPHPCLTLPLGARARLTCGADARFEILESAVA